MNAPDDRRIPLEQAQVIAWKVRAELLPVCERIEIAGSIRRRRPTVKDVEILAIPKVAQRNLFGEATSDQLHEYLKDRLQGDLWALRYSKAGYPAFGLQNKLLTYEGFPVDVFTAAPENWGMALFVRTGPKEWNVRAMRRFRDLDMRGHAYGGVDDAQGNPIPCPTEERVFELLGWRWTPPEERR